MLPIHKAMPNVSDSRTTLTRMPSLLSCTALLAGTGDTCEGETWWMIHVTLAMMVSPKQMNTTRKNSFGTERPRIMDFIGLGSGSVNEIVRSESSEVCCNGGCDLTI